MDFFSTANISSFIFFLEYGILLPLGGASALFTILILRQKHNGDEERMRAQKNFASFLGKLTEIVLGLALLLYWGTFWRFWSAGEGTSFWMFYPSLVFWPIIFLAFVVGMRVAIRVFFFFEGGLGIASFLALTGSILALAGPGILTLPEQGVWGVLAMLEGAKSVIASGLSTLGILLYLSTRKNSALQTPAYYSFLILFKYIWIGFGILVALNIATLLLVYGTGYTNDIFQGATLMRQVMIAFVALGGVYLGKVLGPELIGALRERRGVIASGSTLAWKGIFDGSFVLVSWYTMLALNFFDGLSSLSFAHLMALWAGGYIAAVLGGTIYEHVFLRIPESAIPAQMTKSFKSS